MMYYTYGFDSPLKRCKNAARVRSAEPNADHERGTALPGSPVGLGQTFGDDAPKFSEILIILTQISRKF